MRFSMKLHPLTHIIIITGFGICTVVLPEAAGIICLAIGLVAAFSVRSRTDVALGKLFVKVLITALLFLFLLHGVTWRPIGISPEGSMKGMNSFIKICVPFIVVLYLSKRIRSEEFFALLLDLRIPPIIILILFRTLWLIPRLTERIDEVTMAQQLRGMPIETSLQRIRAIIPTLIPIFTSMVEEIFSNSVVMTISGFLRPGKKSHLIILNYHLRDGFLSVLTIAAVLLSWF
jgi:energy-coupling factor transporter transmembrane protein EcfT